MSLASITVGLGLLVLSAYIVASPWRAARAGAFPTPALWPAGRPSAPTPAVELESQRDSTYAALADLGIDHDLGKVNAEDYQRTRAALLTQAVSALQGLDQVQADLEREVESLVQARRKGVLTCPTCGGDLGPQDEFCSHCGGSAQLHCPKCNTRAAADHHFCRACGASLG
jgi:hypothetical protein